MAVRGDRLVILLLTIPGIAGVFAFSSGYIGVVFERPTQWVLRSLTMVCCTILIALIWRRPRLTSDST